MSDNPLVLGRKFGAFPAFRARWPWIGGDLQTLRNAIHHRPPDFSAYGSERLLLPMRDGSGDRLWALVNRPMHSAAKPVVVLIHGLTGCEVSRNIMTSAESYLRRGHPVVRLNLRNAGPSLGSCTQFYHAGRSADLRDALAALPSDLTAPGLFLVGVSLGGNLLLKFMAERDGTSDVRGAAAVCAPIDLKASQRTLMSGRNAIYHRHLLRCMKRDARRAAGDSNKIEAALAKVRSVYDFDDLIVAPSNGFAGADDYYRRSSAGPVLEDVAIPTLLVHTRTDPWVPASMYLDRQWPPEGSITVVVPPDGGHVGFHAAGSATPWHDRAIGIFFDQLSR